MSMKLLLNNSEFCQFSDNDGCINIIVFTDVFDVIINNIDIADVRQAGVRNLLARSIAKSSVWNRF